MSHNVKITVAFNNGDEHVLVVDYNPATGHPIVKVDRTSDPASPVILRFGRSDGNGHWHELLAAPIASVRSWSRF